jgi:S-adenosylmethionine/arginine decarboxylase-like enzyme
MQERAMPHLKLNISGCSKDKINNEQSITDYLNQLTDLIEMTAITPVFCFKFPFSSEVVRLVQRMEKENVQSEELNKQRAFLDQQATDESGVTGFIVFAESHASVHTFPEKEGGTMIDIFSCKPFEIDSVINFTKHHFEPKNMYVTLENRFFNKLPEIFTTIIGDNNEAKHA